MVECWIGLTNIPTHGREFSFDDQDMWRMLWREFQYDAEILAPLQATLSVIPQPEGYLIQGRLTGTVGTICHRCSEVAKVGLDHHFETFEAYEDTEALEGEENHLRATDTGWELNATALLWEEFLLAMPEKILCSDSCLGLCPQCGKNRNLEQCVCSNLDTQSPLARALQGVKIKNH